MASNEHLVLSNYIKSVHLELREKSKIVGVEKAWQEHCANGTNLKKYAFAMKKLASNYWEKNNSAQSKPTSRVEWTYITCTNYFKRDIIKFQDKEKDVASKISVAIPASNYSPEVINRLTLLDVGSCYNPFKKFECFEVTAIDIAPGLESVIECDFLNLNIGESISIDKEHFELRKNYFDIVVFSLLLEYLPSPSQRLICCEKAYDLLKTEGLLIIITPDSNHVGANAEYMKSWRFILANLGFSRIKYEKLTHIHCMAFRKAYCKEITQRWAELHKEQQVYTEIFIPQDFNVKSADIRDSQTISKQCLSENDSDFMNELSYYNIF